MTTFEKRIGTSGKVTWRVRVRRQGRRGKPNRKITRLGKKLVGIREGVAQGFGSVKLTIKSASYKRVAAAAKKSSRSGRVAEDAVFSDKASPRSPAGSHCHERQSLQSGRFDCMTDSDPQLITRAQNA